MKFKNAAATQRKRNEIKKQKKNDFVFFLNPKISNLFVDDIDRNILSQSL
jgi:hypothetical protein